MVLDLKKFNDYITKDVIMTVEKNNNTIEYLKCRWSNYSYFPNKIKFCIIAFGIPELEKIFTNLSRESKVLIEEK